MVYPDTFEGFAVRSADTWNKFHRHEYKPKPFGPRDVDIEILACGVCGSDVHTITGGWGAVPYPLCVGHEIVGTVKAVGPEVTTLKVGDRAGVGAQIWACLDCRACKNGNEVYCKHQLDTYGATYPDGTVSQGGYSSHVRAHEYFTFPIPDALETNIVAPMLCAGLTVYSPLIRNGAGQGKKVGIVGLGGLGHFAVLFSVALGAETWVISRSDKKREDALNMGAAGFIATDKKGWNEDHEHSFDLIINTANSTEGFDLPAYLSLLYVHGRWISVGLPEGEGSTIKNFDLLGNGCLIGASHLGSRLEVLSMFELAAKSGVKSWIEEIQVGEEGCHEAVTRLHKNDVRYRFVLTGYDKVFKN